MKDTALISRSVQDFSQERVYHFDKLVDHDEVNLMWMDDPLWSWQCYPTTIEQQNHDSVWYNAVKVTVQVKTVKTVTFAYTLVTGLCKYHSSGCLMLASHSHLVVPYQVMKMLLCVNRKGHITGSLGSPLHVTE